MKKLMGLILFLGLSQVANALLIDNGNYTTDDTTGLDWLDLTETFNVAYVDALNGRRGWRYATAGEVGNIFQKFFPLYSPTNVGSDLSKLTVSGSSAGAVQFTQAEYFSSLFGDSQKLRRMNLGMYTRDNDSTLYMTGVDFDFNFNESIVFGLNHRATYQSAMSNGISLYGTYLVRNATPVPEPAPLALMGVGLLGLYVSRRRSRNPDVGVDIQ